MSKHPFAKELVNGDNVPMHHALIVCDPIAKELNAKMAQDKLHAVGKHDLDVWLEAFEAKDERPLSRLPTDWNKEAYNIVFAGCYGNDYARDLELFLNSIAALQKQKDQHVHAWITLHPAIHCDGKIESELISKLQLEESVTVVTKDKRVYTKDLMPFADTLVSPYSSVVLNASFCGIPSGYISASYNDVMTQEGILPLMTTEDEALSFLSNPSKPKAASFPKHAGQNIASVLNAIIASIDEKLE